MSWIVDGALTGLQGHKGPQLNRTCHWGLQAAEEEGGGTTLAVHRGSVCPDLCCEPQTSPGTTARDEESQTPGLQSQDTDGEKWGVRTQGKGF